MLNMDGVQVKINISSRIADKPSTVAAQAHIRLTDPYPRTPRDEPNANVVIDQT